MSSHYRWLQVGQEEMLNILLDQQVLRPCLTTPQQATINLLHNPNVSLARFRNGGRDSMDIHQPAFGFTLNLLHLFHFHHPFISEQSLTSASYFMQYCSSLSLHAYAYTGVLSLSTPLIIPRLTPCIYDKKWLQTILHLNSSHGLWVSVSSKWFFR